MRKGVLEYCILCILARKEAYASAIIEELKAANMIVVEGTLYPLLIREKDVNIIVAEGTTYPLLIRLKKMGLLNYRWEESPQGPPRKYYVITEKGKALLQEMDAAWNEIVTTIETLKK